MTTNNNPVLELSVRWPHLYKELEREFDQTYKNPEASHLLSKSVVRSGFLGQMALNDDEAKTYFEKSYHELKTMPLMARMQEEREIKNRIQPVDQKLLKTFLRALRQKDEHLFERLKTYVRRADKKSAHDYDVREFISLLAEATQMVGEGIGEQHE